MALKGELRRARQTMVEKTAPHSSREGQLLGQGLRTTLCAAPLTPADPALTAFLSQKKKSFN